MRRNKPGRHKQQAVVENLNKLFGIVINSVQNVEEIAKGKVERRWVDLIPTIVNDYNEFQKEKLKENPPIPTTDFGATHCRGKACDILEKGTIVRIPLEEPREAYKLSKKLMGSFRASDLRYDPTERQITKVLLRPG